jgi:hypothetical protein
MRILGGGDSHEVFRTTTGSKSTAATITSTTYNKNVTLFIMSDFLSIIIIQVKIGFSFTFLILH